MGKSTCHPPLQDPHVGGRRADSRKSFSDLHLHITLVTEFENIVRDNAKKVFSFTRIVFSVYYSSPPHHHGDKNLGLSDVIFPTGCAGSQGTGCQPELGQVQPAVGIERS